MPSALTGDLGATVGPVLVGKVAEVFGENLKTGLLAATIFPVSMAMGLFLLKKRRSGKEPKTPEYR